MSCDREKEDDLDSDLIMSKGSIVF